MHRSESFQRCYQRLNIIIYFFDFTLVQHKRHFKIEKVTEFICTHF